MYGLLSTCIITKIANIGEGGAVQIYRKTKRFNSFSAHVSFDILKATAQFAKTPMLTVHQTTHLVVQVFSQRRHLTRHFSLVIPGGAGSIRGFFVVVDNVVVVVVVVAVGVAGGTVCDAPSCADEVVLL